MRESCEGELCLGGLVGRHTLAIRCGCQGNCVVQGSGVPPSSEGGSQVTVTLYGLMEGNARFSGLTGGAVGGGGAGLYNI